jgi:hypothetical protein
MLRRTIAVAGTVALLVAACSHRPPILKSDLDAWVGVPLIELETHHRFSVMPREVRQLSDGSELWILSSCGRHHENVQCTSTPLYGGQTVTNCSGGGTSNRCCKYSFRVIDGHISRFGMHGYCESRCSDRPSSHPCTHDDEVDHVGHL